MYGGSWELISRMSVKSLRREVLSAVPGVPKAAPHQRWRGTTISFGASECPDNMAGAGVLPLITAPVVANMRLHHVLIDGGVGLNVISHAAFKQLQVPGSRLMSHPVLEGKPNANHVRVRISNSRTQQLHNMDIITRCSNSIKREIIVDYIICLRHPHSLYNKSKCRKET
jgi:hypothetical protein